MPSRVRQVAITTGLLHGDISRLASCRVGALEAVTHVTGADGREEVDVKREDVEAEYEGDDPLEDGGRVLRFAKISHSEGDGQDDLDDDEGELDVEGNLDDPVFTVTCLDEIWLAIEG